MIFREDDFPLVVFSHDANGRIGGVAGFIVVLQRYAVVDITIVVAVARLDDGKIGFCIAWSARRMSVDGRWRGCIARQAVVAVIASGILRRRIGGNAL